MERGNLLAATRSYAVQGEKHSLHETILPQYNTLMEFNVHVGI